MTTKKQNKILLPISIVFGIFLLGSIITAFCAMFSGCSTIDQATYKPEYISIVEIKQQYQLTRVESKEVKRAARAGEIQNHSHVTKEHVYDANYDYTQFKVKEDGSK